MKKVYISIASLLLCGSMLMAQSPANRTSKTIVADVLAQMPAEQQAEYNKLINDLSSTGEEGVLMLINKINAPGKGSNSNVDYALSGLTHYVMAKGEENARLVTANAYLKALDKVSDRETKAFIIRQLQLLGKDECVDTLASYLNDESLSGPAARALSAIRTDNAKKVLVASLMRRSGTPKTQKDIIRAIADVQIADAENVLKAMLGSSDENMQKEVLYALSRVGSKASLSDLAAVAEKAGYKMEKTGANEAYIALIKRVLEQGDTKDAEKAANDLLKKSTKAGMTQTREAALQILLAAKPEAATKNLLSALKDTDFYVQQAAVWALVKIGDKSVIPVLADLLKSNDKQVILLGQDALMAFNGDIDQAVAKVIPSASDAGKVAGLELLAIRMADANLNTVLDQIKSGSPEVKKAAYTALKDVVSEKDFTLLCGMLETAEASAIAPLQDAIIAAISKQPAATQVSNVNRRMIQAGDSKRYLYYKVLSATGEKEALATIVEGLNKGNGAAKDAALDALLAWKGIEAADELFKVCQSASSDQVFDRALKRYVQLVSNPAFTRENRLLSLRKVMEIARTSEQKALILRQIQRADTFLALMYASEFLDSSDAAVRSAAVYAVWNIARNHPEYKGDNVKAILKRVLTMFDGEDARYDIDALKQHLDAMPDEVGFVSIFNGKDLTGWKGLVENPIARAKMKPAQLAKAQEKADENMRRDWKVENGLLVFDGTGYDNLCTEKQYGDFEMYVDWMLDPKGPEADAGIYLRGTPQVQIWDTSRVNVGAQVGSGGLYNNQVNESKPSKVADNKLGEWNSFYIKMVGDRVTVVLNGEKVVDNVILENYWDRKLPIFPVEQIEMQAHGSKVYYRNIYVKELEKQEPFKLSPEEEKEGFKVLFDGTNMHEWTGNTVDYILEDGCISMVPSSSFGGNLYTKKEYGNFIYRFDFQLTPGANNGVGIRTPMEGDAAYVGMEVQVLDCEHPIYQGNITPLQHHGSVYGIIPAREDHPKAFKPVGEWNTEEIMADGDHIRVTVNGVVILDGNIRDAVKNGTPDGKEHPGLFNKKGHIGFLGHGSPVKFRNIRIKELK